MDTSLLILFNAHHDIVEFTLPPVYDGEGWMLLFDTNDDALSSTPFEVGAVYTVTGRSLLMFERIPERVVAAEEAPEALAAPAVAKEDEDAVATAAED